MSRPSFGANRTARGSRSRSACAARFLDLAEAFHTRPQSGGRTIEGALDDEEVLAFLGLSDRGDDGDREGVPLVRHGGQDQLTLLTLPDLADVPFGDLHLDPVRLQRSNLEQDLAGLDRRTQGLAQVAADDQPVERGDDRGA